MKPDLELSPSIAEAVRTIHQARPLDATLQTIVEVASSSIPEFDHVGISTLHKGKVTTRAFVGDMVRRLDDLQYSLGEGPCVETLQGSEVVVSAHFRHDQRWARWVPQAAAMGVRSQLAVQMYLDSGGTLGSINFYSTTSDDVGADAQALARLFATHSAIALGHAQERETLTAGLQSRKVVGQAVGILMERYDMNEDRAFAFLVRASSHGNIKLRTIAEELVGARNAT